MVLGFRVRVRLVVWMKAAVCLKNAVRVRHIVGAATHSYSLMKGTMGPDFLKKS